MPTLKRELKFLTIYIGFICPIIFYFLTYFYGNATEY